jgi:hypothetical protein
LVVLGQPGQITQVGGLRTDAERAVVALRADGRPVSVFLKSGRSVTLQDQLLLRLDHPGTAEVRLAGDNLEAQVTYDVTPHAPFPENPTFDCIWQPAQATVNGQSARIQKRPEASRIIL